MRIFVVDDEVQARRILSSGKYWDAIIKKSESDLSAQVTARGDSVYLNVVMLVQSGFTWRLRLSPVKHYTATYVGKLLNLKTLITNIMESHYPNVEVEFLEYKQFSQV